MTGCNFPAKELLRMRRQLVAQADCSTDDAFVRQVAEFVKGTDDLRLVHLEMTECNCWAQALREMDAERLAA